MTCKSVEAAGLGWSISVSALAWRAMRCVVLLVLLALSLRARTITVAVYNVENLFDADGSAAYEDYAGVSFRQRRVQDYTRRGGEPPNPPAKPGWAGRVRDHTVEIALDVRSLPPAATEDPVLWYVGIHDSSGRELYRQDTSEEELSGALAADGGTVRLIREFTSDTMPASWTVLPLSASQGWLAPVTKRVRAA